MSGTPAGSPAVVGRHEQGSAEAGCYKRQKLGTSLGLRKKRMISFSTRPPLPSPLVYPLTDNVRLVELLATVSGKTTDAARRMLYRDQRKPGEYALEDFYGRGLTWGVWSDKLIEYYHENDAFLFGGIGWNRNPAKLALREWIGEYLRRSDPRSLRILCYGDGPGFDSLYLAKCGHDVTYFEVSDLLIRFAREAFRAGDATIDIVTKEADIQANSYDAVVCLDVLEHVPAPAALVARLVRWMRPDGRLIVHAPFYFVSPEMPTHLRCNTRYGGTMSLFTREGLRFLDGRPFWMPLVFGRSASVEPAAAGLFRRSLLRLTGIPLFISRLWPQPLARSILRKLENDPRWDEGLAPSPHDGTAPSFQPVTRRQQKS
jgi:SAM-dependent methyltransferase